MPYRRKDSEYLWISYTDASGKRIRVSSGTTSRSEAKVLEAKRRAETHRVTKWGDEPARTFDELMLGYLKETEAKKSHDRDLYCAANLSAYFSGKVIAELGPEEISEYKRLRKAGELGASEDCKAVKDATVAKELLLISAAIRHANANWDWKLPNPISGRVPKASKGAPKWLKPEEVDRLKAAVRKSPHLLDFIELGLMTGMRCEEMLALDWSRVDFGARLVLFDEHDQKSGVPGSIPLNNGAIAVLRRREAFRRQHCPSSPWVFCVPSGERLQYIKRTFARAAKRAGVKASPHSLRHTFASRLAQAGIPMRTVADLCRHADIRTTMRYAYLAPDNARAAIELLDRDQNVTDISSTGGVAWACRS